MKFLPSLLIIFVWCGISTGQDQRVLIIVGASGADEYALQFQQWAELWKTAAKHTELKVIGLEKDNPKPDRDILAAAISETSDNMAELWIVLLGHGTFDGNQAKFNMRGPDITAEDLSQWLDQKPQKIVVINCTSSSSPFINALSKLNRIVITATKSGFQYNYARFGQFIAKTINDPAADLDKDGQTSVLEAFISASTQLQNYYAQERRLSTELALLDDNGDALGTPADWFEGTRSNQEAKNGIPDGFAANQIALSRQGTNALLTTTQRDRRDQLERDIEVLRKKKDQLTELQYLAAIEPLMVEIAKIYAAAEKGRDLP